MPAKDNEKKLQASLPKTNKLIMLTNYIVRSALLSLVSENITIREILFASCQSMESQLVLPYMIHKGKGL